jgi:hypothetical protein
MKEIKEEKAKDNYENGVRDMIIENKVIADQYDTFQDMRKGEKII